MNNLYQFLVQNKLNNPNQMALSILSMHDQKPVESNYLKLVNDIDQYADYLSHFLKTDLKKNQKVILALPVSYELYVTVFALFKLGACAVLLNPNLNRQSLNHCLKLVNADCIISNKAILKYRFLFWEIFKIKNKISLNSNGLGVKNLFLKKGEAATINVEPNQHALISFTSGSSGFPKAVARTYENLWAQHTYLKKLPSIENHYDITAFPVVALHHLCNGIHCEVADIDYKNIKSVKNNRICQQIINKKVNSLTGAAQFLISLGQFLKENNLAADHIQVIATGGSPISNSDIAIIKQYFSNARLFILYGSSEAEPIAHIEVKSNLDQTKGYLVGETAEDIKLAFDPIKNGIIHDASISDFSNDNGEIYVSGLHVCKQYFKNDAANKKFKFKDQDNNIWHRTGDIGFLNESNQLVLTGRIENCIKSDNGLIGSYPIEIFINDLIGAKKCAVVEKLDGKINAYVESSNQFDKPDIIKKVNDEFSIELLDIKTIERIPVDARHQGKIQYDKLK